ncbi:CBS domain-containing protein [Pedobacter sp. SYP-B3415]|uniref:CBS domain-containing protein n=1 Tax=Pedobacter sp. SYP-B3415 TaxID=2496641 RepID=UPI003512E760
MTTVKKLLDSKDAAVFSVHGNTSVFDVLTEMMKQNISAIFVIASGRLKGIFTERDYARKIILQGRASKETPVCDVM